jgi:hypothetical protein
LLAGRDLSIVELDLFEPADGVALVGNDLCLPDKGDRHGSHDQEAEDKSDPDVRLANLTPKDAANPWHGRVLLVLMSLSKQTVVGDASLPAKKAEQSNRHTRTFSNTTHLAENMYLV